MSRQRGYTSIEARLSRYTVIGIESTYFIYIYIYNELSYVFWGTWGEAGLYICILGRIYRYIKVPQIYLVYYECIYFFICVCIKVVYVLD